MWRDPGTIVWKTVVGLSILYLLVGLPPAFAETIKVQVTFMDGGTLDVGDVSLVYSWASTIDRKKYWNPKVYKRTSNSLCHEVVVRTVPIRRLVPLKDIMSLDIDYQLQAPMGSKLPPPPKGTEYCTPRVLKIRMRDGKAMEVMAVKVPSEPSDKPDDPPSLWALHLTGTATIEGSKGKFEGRLWFEGTGGCPDAESAPKRIVFHYEQ